MDKREMSSSPVYYGERFGPDEWTEKDTNKHFFETGLTKFEECAMRFHSAILSNPPFGHINGDGDPEEFARQAIRHAEAFFDALDRRDEKKKVEESLQ